MADTYIAALPVVINDDKMTYLEHEGQLLFSAEEIGKHLGYKNPADSINVLYRRNIEELQGYAVAINLIATDGKSYEVRHFAEEGVYIISMLANTPNAVSFRQVLAKFLREIREHKIQLARESGYMQGRDEALCLPVMEAERKKGYLAGLKEADRLWRRNSSPRALRRMMELRSKGCTWPEIGKILGVSPQAARKRVARACASGGVL